MPAAQPSWLRWRIVVPLGVVYAVAVAWLANQLGMWVVLTALGALAAGGWYLTFDADRRERRARLKHLGERNPVEVEQQIRRLVNEEELDPGPQGITELADRWAKAARILRVDPRRLRAADELGRDFRPLVSPLASYSVLEDFEEEIEMRACDEDIYLGDGTCPACGYSHEGLPPERCCPECGRRVFPLIRTFGAYLLFVAGLKPTAHP